MQRLPAAVIGSAASLEAPLVMWDISLREVTNWMAVAEIGWPFPRMHREDSRVAVPTVAASRRAPGDTLAESQHAPDWLHPAAASRRPETERTDRREKAEHEERGAHDGLAVASL